jgi:hypothetical protein
MECVNRRVRGSGLSCASTLRLKSHSIGSVETRLAELEMTLPDYLRELIRQDIGVSV